MKTTRNLCSKELFLIFEAHCFFSTLRPTSHKFSKILCVSSNCIFQNFEILSKKDLKSFVLNTTWLLLQIFTVNICIYLTRWSILFTFKNFIDYFVYAHIEKFHGSLSLPYFFTLTESYWMMLKSKITLLEIAKC